MVTLNSKVQYLETADVEHLHDDLKLLLNTLAYYYEGLFITCGFRSKEHDLARGRSGNSAHTRGLAVDIRCVDNFQRWRLLDSINTLRMSRPDLFHHVNRVGICSAFIHLDIDESLPNNRIWLYE